MVEDWIESLGNEHTRRAYRRMAGAFVSYAGVGSDQDWARVSVADVIAWRGDLGAQGYSPSTITVHLCALAGLFDYLRARGVVTDNPVRGVRHPPEKHRPGAPRLTALQAGALLDAPRGDTLKGKRDRAILAALLYHGIKRHELCALRVRDLERGCGEAHLRIREDDGTVRRAPLDHEALMFIDEYLDMAGHGKDSEGPLFRPLPRGKGFNARRALTGVAVYHDIVRRHAKACGLDLYGRGLSTEAVRGEGVLEF